jgi:hypothetical protein
MFQRVRSHLTFANVISALCLFFVLGGGTAVALTGSNTVQSDDLGPGAQVKAPDVAANAVDGPDVKDLTFQTLTLKNGWVGNCFGGGVPAIAKGVEGVIYFRGEMCRSTGTSNNPFAVPAGFRPTKVQWLTTDQVNASTGRLFIDTTGEAFVTDDTDHASSGAAFTSLQGVSYTLPF